MVSERPMFGDERCIALDRFAARYVYVGIGPAGICQQCGCPLETVGDVADGICPACALRLPEQQRGGGAG